MLYINVYISTYIHIYIYIYLESLIRLSGLQDLCVGFWGFGIASPALNAEPCTALSALNPTIPA